LVNRKSPTADTNRHIIDGRMS